MEKVKGNFGRLMGLIGKNLKLAYRTKPNYFWVFGYPLLFALIFAIAFNTAGGDRTVYHIAIFNEDVIGANNELEQNASLIFENLFDNSDPDNELAKSFLRSTAHTNGTAYTKPEAIEFVKKGSLDAVIIIPQNFSESIIGSTWWYKMFKSPEFTALPSPIQQGMLASIPAQWAVVVQDPSVLLPANSTPSIEIQTKPDMVTRAVVTNVIDGLVNDIILGFNNVTGAEINVEITGVVQSISIYDWMAPGLIIVGVTIAVMMVAESFGNEKDKGLIRRLDTTPVPRHVQLLAGAGAQLIFTAIQVVILSGVLVALGFNVHPDANWGLAFLNAMIMAIPCIGIGLIIAALVKSGSEAGGLSWIAILPLQFLGNAFFNLGEKGIMQFVPTFYGIRSMQKILIFGMGIGDIWMDLLVNALFGLGFIVLGLLIFHKKSQV
jgi:ABC-2 type transport system permease protein